VPCSANSPSSSARTAREPCKRAAKREQHALGDHRHRNRYWHLDSHRYSVFSELQAALNLIWKVPAARTLGVWHLLKSRLLSLSIILVIGFVLLVSLVISAALAAFSQYLDEILPGLPTILHILHLGLAFVCTTVLFALLFKILPDKPVEWEEVWLGATVTALLFTAGKHLINLYILSSNMASTFGAAGALIIIFVWVYYSAQILLLGAELAKAHGDQKAAASVAVVASNL
jgi:membrane protein